jgi:osmotically-inducible protein OsmY
MKAILAILLAAPLATAGCKEHRDHATSADDTAHNRRDPNNAVTADQGASHGDDLALTAQVRRALIRDDALSTDAHNVKIVVDRGVVTLAGPVASADERSKVETIAEAVPGTARVVNNTEIKD